MNRRLIEKADKLLEKEKGTVYKDPGGKINIALVYPNTYNVGMSNLGFQGIYGLLNSMKDVVCERAFLPEDKDIDEYYRSETELFTMESKRTLNRFDIVALSVSFENDYPHIMKIFELSRLPVRSSERKEHHPLVIVGGACSFYNPEPLADFFDICFIGEADEALPEFLNVLRSFGERSEILKKSLSIEGLYVPEFYQISYSSEGKISRRRSLGDAPEIVRRRYLEDISKSRITASITTPKTEFSEMYLVEAMRGCPWSCRFCVAGKIYSPTRMKELKTIEDEIKTALYHTRRVGLIGPSLSDYPYIKEVLKNSEVNFSITSLRASKKSAELAGFIRNRKSVSIAPEVGTERLRKVIHKKVTEEDILHTSELIFSSDIENLRLYFMVGLPTETREDIKGTINLVKKIRNISPKGSLTLSISTFVPKPFTPFQWHPMESLSEVKERLKMIKKALVSVKGIKVFHDVPKYAYMQCLFSLGDRRVSKVLETMPRISEWMKAVEVSGLNRDFYISRKKDFNEILPWDFIDMGIEKDALWKEYQEALNENSS